LRRRLLSRFTAVLDKQMEDIFVRIVVNDLVKNKLPVTESNHDKVVDGFNNRVFGADILEDFVVEDDGAVDDGIYRESITYKFIFNLTAKYINNLLQLIPH
jgi:hypothetical protein